MKERMSASDQARLVVAREAHLGGDLDAAQNAYRRLRRKYPRNADVKSLLGALHLARGEHAAAIPLLEHVSRARKTDADAFYNLGLAFAGSNEHEKAVAHYKRAIRCNAAHPAAHYNLGFSLRNLDRNAEAVEALCADHALKPSFDTCRLLRKCCMALERYEDALAYAEQCVEMEGANLSDLNALVLLLCYNHARASTMSDEDVGTLRALAHRAVELGPNDVEAWVNEGRALTMLGATDEAIAPLARAVQLAPESDEGNALHAVALLSEGRLHQGWHARSLLERMHKPITATGVPRWQGQLQPGYRLWLTKEQGVGDQIIFASAMGDLVNAGMEVTLVSDPRLIPLLTRSMPHVTFCEAIAEADQPAFDGFAPMGEMLLHLREHKDKLPAPHPYLSADPDETALFRGRYEAAYPGQRIIGLAWLSHSDVNGAGKSIPLDDLLPILTLPGCVFVCVQYGEGAEALRAHAAQHGYQVHIDQDCDPLTDLDGAAAQLAALDELVSVSNASVHMAGALGVRTHVLLSKRPVWHWFREGSRAPWYPDVHLYRQQRLETWQHPIATLAEALSRA